MLADMQELTPTADNGQPAYAFSLFKDWDGNMMVTAKQPACFYGYDEIGFVLAKADGSDYQSILDPDGEYIRNLRLYYEANQLGLVDPESTTQNYDTLFSKFQNGQVLFSWWPWLGQSAYNTEENMAAGKGFEMAPLQDQTIFSYGAEAYGGKQVFAIGSKAEDPERIAAFIDWLYSAEGAYANSSQTMGSAGPAGPHVGRQRRRRARAHRLRQRGLPRGRRDGSRGVGRRRLRRRRLGAQRRVGAADRHRPRDRASRTATRSGRSYQAAIANPLTEDWSAKMGGATSTMEYLQANDQVLVAPGASYAAPADDSETETLRNQVKEIIKQYSWQMVFAENDAQFESLRDELIETANGLGYEEVLEVDMDNAKAQNDARVAVTEEFAG